MSCKMARLTELLYKTVSAYLTVEGVEGFVEERKRLLGIMDEQTAALKAEIEVMKVVEGIVEIEEKNKG